ncbi:MAG: DUF6549 family protein [Mucinivorans sp.]
MGNTQAANLSIVPNLLISNFRPTKKRYLIIAILALCIALGVMFALWRGAVNERQRVETNFQITTTTAHSYSVRDSLSALSQGVMQIKIDELRTLRAADVQLIKAMGLRLHRVESVAKIATTSHYRYSITPEHDKVWLMKDNYIDLRATIDSSKLDIELKISDTITQILHRIPRFKILGIWFGTKGVRQEIVSKNPHTKIIAAEFLKIIR